MYSLHWWCKSDKLIGVHLSQVQQPEVLEAIRSAGCDTVAGCAVDPPVVPKILEPSLRETPIEKLIKTPRATERYSPWFFLEKILLCLNSPAVSAKILSTFEPWVAESEALRFDDSAVTLPPERLHLAGLHLNLALNYRTIDHLSLQPLWIPTVF